MADYHAALKMADEDTARFFAGTNSIPAGERGKAEDAARAQLRNSLKLMIGKLKLARAALSAYLSETESSSGEIFKAEDKLVSFIAGRSSWLKKWKHCYRRPRIPQFSPV